jgi:signal transduction histidine kinase
MLSDQAKSLLILYTGLVLLNAVISFWFWRVTRLSIYAHLVQIWVGISISFGVGGITQGNQLLFPLLGIMPGSFIAGTGGAQVLLRFIGRRPNYKFLLLLQAFAGILLLILYAAGLPFVIFAIPVAFIISGPLLYGLVRLMREKTEPLTPAKAGFAVACLAMVFHGLDFPFLGDRPETIVIGLSIGIIVVMGLAVFGPLVVLEVANADAAQLKLERGEMEKELQGASLMQELIADTASLLPLSLDYKGVIEQAVKLGSAHFGGVCTLHVLEDGPESLHLAAVAHRYVAGDSGETRAFEDRVRSSGSVQSVIKEAVQGAEPARGIVPSSEIRDPVSYISVPLRGRGHVGGALSFFSKRSHSDRDLRLAMELGGRVSSAIQSAELFQEVQQAVRLRDDFLAVASHELKTPLTSLNIQVETLRNLVDRERLAAFPQDQLKRMLKMSAEQLKSLSKLIEGLLDVSRITAKGIVLGQKEEVDLSQLVREVAGRFEAQLHASHCRLELRAEQSVTGRWDRTRVEQIVTNLLTNAMKYGAGKPVRLEVTRQEQMALLVVQDFGIGIAAEDRERIFWRFERAVPVQRFGGLGLGLYIAREIARAHGGTIRVEGEPGVETRFIVELPID